VTNAIILDCDQQVYFLTIRYKNKEIKTPIRIGSNPKGISIAKKINNKVENTPESIADSASSSFFFYKIKPDAKNKDQVNNKYKNV
jgi:4-hydroxy-3-methylbut-2-en-1-yl diphosphate synthase IspG/GcpE